jgi:hypothetical protein
VLGDEPMPDWLPLSWLWLVRSNSVIFFCGRIVRGRIVLAPCGTIAAFSRLLLQGKSSLLEVMLPSSCSVLRKMSKNLKEGCNLHMYVGF